MQDMYPNLPGIMAQFKDGGLQIKSDPNPPGTESVVLLGTAIDGPLLEPVAVDQNTVELVFGKAVRPNGLPNGSTLVKGFEQAYAAGSRDIRLMRVTGDYAKGQVAADKVTTTTDIAVDDIIGPAPGNIATTLKLNHGNVIASSVVVNANGVNLPVSAFTVNVGAPDATPSATPVEGSVDVKANVTDSNAAVYITYQYDDGTGKIVTTQQNGHVDATGVLERYYAAGQDSILNISAVAKPGSLVLYAGGVQVDPAGFQVAGSTVTLHPGFVALNANLEATFLNVQTATEAPVIQIQSVFAGALYNNVSVAVKDITNQTGQVVGKQVVVTKPDAKKAQVAEAPLAYSSLDYPSFQLMVNAINTDPLNNVVRASVATRFQNSDTTKLVASPASFLAGGDDGLAVNTQGMYEALGGVRDISTGILLKQGAYQLLENYTVDNVVPLGVAADTKLAGKYDSFAYQLALAAAVMSFRNHSTIGHIATSSPDEVGLKAVADQVAALSAAKNDFFMRDRQGNILKDSEGQNIDLGRFVNIVAGPDIVFNSPRLGVYSENSAAAYAGFVSQLAPQSAPTNKVLAFAAGLRYTFSNAQLDQLTGKRFVTFKTKNNGAAVAVTDAMTAAQPASDYKRLTTIRVVKEAVNQIRIVADPFIGEPNETAQQNALSAAISKRLDLLKQNGVISNYEFHIIASAQDQLLGQAQIELTIVPPQELRRLTTVVSLKPSL